MSTHVYQDGFDYGVGYDTLASRVRGWPVEITSAVPMAEAAGSSVTFTMDLMQSYRQLRTALGISAGASLNLGVFSGSAAFSFLDEHAIDQYSLYLLAQVRVTQAQARMQDVRLKEEAAELMAQFGEDVFRERYGDEFVVGLTTGGRYVGLLRVDTTSQIDKSDIRSSLEASGFLGIGSASGEFLSSTVDMLGRHRTTVWSFQDGGPQLDPAVNYSDMVNKAINFPMTVNQAPRPYVVETLDYKALPLPPGKNPIDVFQQQTVLRTLAEYRANLIDHLADIDFILQHQDKFDNPDIPALNQLANQLRALINEVYEAASTCFNDYKQCRLLTNMQVPPISLPLRKPHLPAPPSRPAGPVPGTPPELKTEILKNEDVIRLSWPDVGSETHYVIERTTTGQHQSTGDPNTFKEIARVPADITSFDDSQVDRKTSYWYRVKATNADGESSYTYSRGRNIGEWRATHGKERFDT